MFTALPVTLLETGSRVQLSQFAADVKAGLQARRKTLPSRYLYDAVGSALFDAITVLPEYGLTRADERLLERHANEIAHRIRPYVMVAELGSGNGRKTRPILEALATRQRLVTYHAIDTSASALARCQKEVSGLTGVQVRTVENLYLEGLEEVSALRSPGEHMLLLFLGSTIGNFDPPQALELLSRIRDFLQHDDALLLGADLVKQVSDLIRAYDDPAGVTAAFDLNYLARINRELGANFDLRQFRHEARWSPEHRRIEMHLRSTMHQTVDIPLAGFRAAFAPGETIWTESSHKFVAQELDDLARRAGFMPAVQWIDGEWPFSENLWMVP